MQTVTGAVVQDRAHGGRSEQHCICFDKCFYFSYYVAACVYVFVQVYRVLHVIQERNISMTATQASARDDRYNSWTFHFHMIDRCARVRVVTHWLLDY